MESVRDFIAHSCSFPSLQVLSGRRLLFGWEALCGCDQDAQCLLAPGHWHHSFIPVSVPPSFSSSRSTWVSLCPLYPTTKALQLALRHCTSLWHKNIEFPMLRLRTPPGPISPGLSVLWMLPLWCHGAHGLLHEACFPSVSSPPLPCIC